MPVSRQMIEDLSSALLVKGQTEKDRAIIAGVNRGEYAGFGLNNAFRAILAAEGLEGAENLTPYETARRVLNAFYEVRDSAHPQMISSNSLNSLLSNTVQSALKIGFTSAKTSYQMLSTPHPVKDLKSCEIRSLSELSTALEIPEGQAPKLASISDRMDAVQLKSYGLAVMLTEQSIADDQLGLATSCVAAIGRSISMALNKLYWSTLIGNPTMSEDSTALFTNAHGNLIAPVALSEATLQTAVAAMLAQRLASPGGQAGELGAIRPAFLVTDPSQMQIALRLTGANYQPLEGWRVTPICEPLVPAGTWFLFADPQEVDYAASCFLNGRPEPTSRVRIGQPGEVKGIVLDGQHYASVKFTDFRAIVKVGA